jgi:hypothetical protein
MSCTSIIEGLSEGVWSDTKPLELPAAECNVSEHEPIILGKWTEEDVNDFARMNKHGLYFMTELDRGDGTRLVRTCVLLYDAVLLP